MPADAKDVVADWREAWAAYDAEPSVFNGILKAAALGDAGDALCAEVERLRLANQRLREVLLAYVDFHQSCEDHHRDECENPETCVGPTGLPLSVHTSEATPTRSLSEASTVTPAEPSFDAALYQPVPAATSPVVTSTDGLVVSRTRTVKLPVVVMPPVSVTEQLTVVLPRANVEPDAGEHDGVGSGSSSASVAETP